MKELTPEDLDRIEDEAKQRYTLSDHKTLFELGAEYATKYEREKNGESLSQVQIDYYENKIEKVIRNEMQCAERVKELEAEVKAKDERIEALLCNHGLTKAKLEVIAAKERIRELEAALFGVLDCTDGDERYQEYETIKSAQVTLTRKTE